MKVIIVAVLGCMFCVGCASSSMSLKKIDQDIPSALVAKYNTVQSPYVDQGEAYILPLLLHYEEAVAKTDKGFQAYRDSDFGLGLLVLGKEQSDFDQKGQLMKYDGRSSLLTGLLLSERSSAVRKGEELKQGHAWWILWGAIGFAEEPNGAKKLSLLWIPIPVSRGD